MSVGLFILSRDVRFIEELRARLGGPSELVVAETLEDAETKLAQRPVGAALAHFGVGTINGHAPAAFFDRLEQLVAAAPLYAVLDAGCPSPLRDLAERKARECLPMPVDFVRLAELLNRPACEEFDPAALSSDLPRRVLRGQTRSFVTFSPAMFTMIEELKVAALHDVTVLLIGESGSGKSYLARLIHELSPRRDQRFVSVACGALLPETVERELFGCANKAASEADAGKPGRLAAAANGTLLIGEVEALSLDHQAKLLRVIETGLYEPLGSGETCRTSARLVVASNLSLERLVQAGKFREDLYYRLSALNFALPPLRERPADIEYLARQFAAEYGRTYRIPVRRIEPEFIEALRQHRWPGNVRELESVMRRALLYCCEGVLSPLDLPPSLRPGEPVPGQNGHADGGGPNGRVKWLSLEERIEEIERRIIEDSLRRHDFHRIRTARELGISRVTLYNKMKKFGMLTPELSKESPR